MGQQSSIEQLGPDDRALYMSMSSETKSKMTELYEKNRQLGPCLERLSEMRQKYYHMLVETKQQLVLAEQQLLQEQKRFAEISQTRAGCQVSQQALNRELNQKIQVVRDAVASHEQMVRLHESNDKQIDQLKLQIEQTEKQSIRCEINRDLCFEAKERLRNDFKTIVEELDARKQALVLKLQA